MNHLKSVLLVSVSFLSASAAIASPDLGIEREWDSRNSPTIFSNRFESSFEKMPLSARLPDEKVPWSDTYWPSQLGGIAHRWNSSNPMDFEYKSPSREQALKMTAEQLAELSPAEKYDLYVGDYSYPTVKAVWSRTSPRQPGWYGICHGWSPASLHFREPAPVTVTNPDGVVIPFGSSDIKALLSYYYATKGLSHSRQLGRRCSKLSKFFGTSACKDVNAGSFHIVLTNQIAFLKKGFIGDLSGGDQVWNFPVFAYSAEVIDTDPAPRHAEDGVAKRIRMHTRIEVGSDGAEPQWAPSRGTAQFKQAQRTYDYWLDIDRNGNIVGGEWISQDFPDFLWTSDLIPFEGHFAQISQLYRPNEILK